MTLAEYNQRIGCPTQQGAMVIVAQLLEGVAHLVHHGIAHRDLKSNNVLVELTEGEAAVPQSVQMPMRPFWKIPLTAMSHLGHHTKGHLFLVYTT